MNVLLLNHCIVNYVACQLLSKSTDDGLTLYQHHVDSLRDAGPTIEFTRRINDLFDLMNSRVPADGIRLQSKRDKISVSI